MSLNEWLKEYAEKERRRQEYIDNDPNAQTLYTFEIDVDTLEMKGYQQKELDYDEDVTGYATYEESLQGNRVYAESLESEFDARELVYNFCAKFERCMEPIRHNLQLLSIKSEVTK